MCSYPYVKTSPPEQAAECVAVRQHVVRHQRTCEVSLSRLEGCIQQVVALQLSLPQLPKLGLKLVHRDEIQGVDSIKS